MAVESPKPGPGGFLAEEVLSWLEPRSESRVAQSITEGEQQMASGVPLVTVDDLLRQDED